MKEHAGVIASLSALVIIIAAALALTFHGAKDETLLAILFTGAVGIANTIAGVKPATPPGTTTYATNTTPAAPPPGAVPNERNQ